MLLALLTLTIAIAVSVTAQRYMHVSPAALGSTIRLLDSPGIPLQRGDNLETVGETIGSLRLEQVKWVGDGLEPRSGGILLILIRTRAFQTPAKCLRCGLLATDGLSSPEGRSGSDQPILFRCNRLDLV